MCLVKDENYYQISGWMINKLKLKGTELQVFAIIYGFSQGEQGVFTGSSRYLQDFTGCSRTAIINALNSLVEKKFLIKKSKNINGVTLNEYSVPVVQNLYRGSTENVPGVVQNLYRGSTESVPNNIDINKIDNKEDNKDNIVENPKPPKTLEEIRKELVEKKVEQSKEQAVSVLDKLNKLAGTKYRSGQNNIEPIIARLKEGFSVEDAITVVEYKCKEWKGTEMQKYLRPETLFRASKFEGYLNAALSGAPAQANGRVCADTCASKSGGKAFSELSKTEQKAKLSGVKF